MFHTYKVLDKDDIANFANELAQLPADRAKNRLVMIEVIYGEWQRNKIEKAFFKLTRQRGVKRGYRKDNV